MLPAIPENLWSRVTHWMHAPATEDAGPQHLLGECAAALSGCNGAAVAAPGAISSRAWTVGSLAALSALVLLLYARVLGPMVAQCWSDPNYGHGFLVPVFAVWVLWRERQRWREVPIRASNWGLVILFCAMGLLLLGTLGSEHFTERISLLVLIAGIVVFLAGWSALRHAAFPLGYLAFMVPLPAIVYYQLTFPLQLLASRLGADGLIALGVPTIREGNLLILPNVTLEVVEACSGVRSLLSLLAAVVAYVYLFEPSLWKRCLLIVAIVPVVIVSNALRLVATGALSYRYGPGVDSGVTHTALGLVCFVAGFLAILLLHRLLGSGPGKAAPAPAS
jgi:exosortase